MIKSKKIRIVIFIIVAIFLITGLGLGLAKLFPKKIPPEKGTRKVAPKAPQIPSEEIIPEIAPRIDQEVRESALADLAERYNIEVLDEEMEKAGEMWPEFEGLKPGESLKRLIIQKKAEPYILKYIEGASIQSRYDKYFELEPAKADEKAKEKINWAYNLLEKGKPIEEIKELVLADPLSDVVFGVWKKRIDKGFKETVTASTADFIEVTKDLQIGEYSKPYRSAGGFYFIFYVTEIGQGKYDTFFEFLKDCEKGVAEY